MEKRKYMKPRTTRVTVNGEGFLLMASDQESLKYNSSNLGFGNGISGKGEGGDAASALSKGAFWDL